MTSPLRDPIPARLNPAIHLVPLMEVPVPAGFPSPAEDWVEDRVDLNQCFVPHPEATFFFG